MIGKITNTLLVSLFLPSLAFAQEAPPIVGGYQTSDFQQVGQIFAYNQNQGGFGFCSGTLIHPQWVLTAAHCIAGSDAAQAMANQGFDIYFVVATDVYDELSNGTQTAISYVASMEAHSGYNPNDTSSIRDDIGLLKLAQPIYSISPMPLNRQTPNTSWDDIRYVGFGITSINGNDGGLRRTVEVPLNDSNNQYWPYTTDSMFMFTWDPAGRTNICSGDSGGAALRQLSNGTYSLAGVNSFGMNVQGGNDSCSGVGAVAGSTRVDVYYPWISSRVDLTSVEPSSEPTSEPSSSPTSEPSSNPSSEPGTVDGDWEAPFSSGNYDEENGSIKASCATMSKSSLLGFALSLGFVAIRRRREKS